MNDVTYGFHKLFTYYYCYNVSDMTDLDIFCPFIGINVEEWHN